MSMQLIVQTNRLSSLRQNLRRALSLVIRKTAFDIEAMAKQDAPVDTGALRASIYVALVGGGGDYADSLAAAASHISGAQSTGKTPKGRTVGSKHPLLQEVMTTEDLTAFVVVGAEYGAPVESKQPFLLPAMERARAGFEEAVRQVFNRAAQ